MPLRTVFFYGVLIIERGKYTGLFGQILLLAPIAFNFLFLLPGLFAVSAERPPVHRMPALIEVFSRTFRETTLSEFDSCTLTDTSTDTGSGCFQAEVYY